MNELGWHKRRETYIEAGMLDEDTLLADLKTQEQQSAVKDEDFFNMDDLLPKFSIQQPALAKFGSVIDEI